MPRCDPAPKRQDPRRPTDRGGRDREDGGVRIARRRVAMLALGRTAPDRRSSAISYGEPPALPVNPRRVEDGRRCSEHEARGPVSHPRSSNPACEFPAPGFPTGFLVGPKPSSPRRLHPGIKSLPGMPCHLPRWTEPVLVSVTSRLVLPSPFPWRVGFHNFTFEACSSFTHITACRVLAHKRSQPESSWN